MFTSTITQNGATIGTYVYNAMNERVSKSHGSTTTRFVYDQASQLISEASGSTRRDYIAVAGIPLAVADGASLGFITADGLGSPRAVTSSTGAVVWTWPYATNPFGENRPVSNTGYVLNLRLPGQYADGEAGLKYNLNRSFDAATGRYLESDPVGLAAGPSTYAYGEGNPISKRDPLGLWSFSFEAYLGFGGGIQFGRDPTSGEWFYGGRLGVGASIGGSLDPAGKRPGADGEECTHGSTLGIFNQAGITIGAASWNPIQNSVGLNLDRSGKGYEEHGPADSLTLNRTSPKAFGIGWSTGIEVLGD